MNVDHNFEVSHQPKRYLAEVTGTFFRTRCVFCVAKPMLLLSNHCIIVMTNRYDLPGQQSKSHLFISEVIYYNHVLHASVWVLIVMPSK